MSTPLSLDANASMLGTVSSANAILYALAMELTSDDVAVLHAMDFPPCGRAHCNCHLRKTTIKQPILSCHADLADPRLEHSLTPTTPQGLDSQAAAQNPRLN